MHQIDLQFTCVECWDETHLLGELDCRVASLRNLAISTTGVEGVAAEANLSDASDGGERRADTALGNMG